MRDFAGHVVGPSRSPDRTSVYEITSKHAVSLDAELATEYAARLLTCLPLARAIVMGKGSASGS